MHSVLETLFNTSFLNTGTKYQFRQSSDIMESIKKNQNYFIEIRMLKQDGINTYETTWPDKGSLKFNDLILKEFKPLAVNSSIKKRKDEKLTIRDHYKQSAYAENTLQIFYENAFDNKNTKIGDNPKYVFAIYLIEKLSVEKLSEKILKERTLTLQQSKQFISGLFQSEMENGIEVSEIKLDPLCCILSTPVNLPARGKWCMHPNCFSLLAFQESMLNNFTRKWCCPICRKRCYYINYDQYVDNVVKGIYQSDDNVCTDIILDNNGDYQIIRTNLNDDSIAGNIENEKQTDEKFVNENKAAINSGNNIRELNGQLTSFKKEAGTEHAEHLIKKKKKTERKNIEVCNIECQEDSDDNMNNLENCEGINNKDCGTKNYGKSNQVTSNNNNNVV